MIRMSALHTGFVFRDPTDLKDVTHSAVERSWYEVVHVSPQVVSARHIATRAPRKWTRLDCKRLIAASNEPKCATDLSCLVGKKVKVTLAHGIVTGTVRGFEFQSVEIKLGELSYTVKTPTMLSLGEEPWSFAEIRRLELIDG